MTMKFQLRKNSWILIYCMLKKVMNYAIEDVCPNSNNNPPYPTDYVILICI
jgi:hypothetical protein